MLTRENSDIKNKLDQVLNILPNLAQIYSKGDDSIEKAIVCSIFKEKIEFHETTFRTPQINSALSSILFINNQLQSKKKGKITNKSDFSLRVTAEVQFSNTFAEDLNKLAKLSSFIIA